MTNPSNAQKYSRWKNNIGYLPVFYIFASVCLYFVIYFIFLPPDSSFLYGKSHDQILQNKFKSHQLGATTTHWYPFRENPGLNAPHRICFNRRCVDNKFIRTWAPVAVHFFIGLNRVQNIWSLKIWSFHIFQLFCGVFYIYKSLACIFLVWGSIFEHYIKRIY